MLKVIDTSVLEKVGMDNAHERTQVVEVINACTTLLGQERNNSLLLFGRSLKRKIDEVDAVFLDNQRLLMETKRTEEDMLDFQTKATELSDENYKLKQQIEGLRNTMARLKEEAKDLREIQKQSGKSTADLRDKITNLTTELKSCDEKWQDKYAEVKKERSHFKKKTAALERENANLKKMCDQKSEEAKKLSDTIQENFDKRESELIEFNSKALETREALRKEMDESKLKLQLEIDDMRNELEGKAMQISLMTASKNDFMQKTRADLHAEYQIIVDSLNQIITRSQAMSSFQDKTTGLPAVCPIPTKSGFIDSFHNIMSQWMSTPSDNEGELHASFRCAVTGAPTSVASVEQVTLVRAIACDMNYPVKPPLYLEIFNETSNQWEEFSFIEQLTMISKMCKIYRRKTMDGTVDHLVVANGQYLLTFQFNTFPDGRSSMAFRLMPLASNFVPPIRLVVTEPVPFEGLEFMHATPAIRPGPEQPLKQ